MCVDITSTVDHKPVFNNGGVLDHERMDDVGPHVQFVVVIVFF